MKGLSSLCFVLFGGINLITSEFSLAKLLLFVGLCFGIVGDEILALCQIYPNHDKQHFLGGGVFFVVGHVCYMATMIFLLGGPNWIAVAIAFATIILLSFLFEKKKNFYSCEYGTSLKIYISIVILFASIGVATFLKNGTLATSFLGLGGILFAISDNILFAYKLGKDSNFKQNIYLHATYYLAQILIAWCIALV